MQRSRIISMISISEITHQLKKVFSNPLLERNKKLNRPLLNDKEILNLMLRVQSSKKTGSYKYDIAHRKLGDVSSIYRGHGMDYEESRHYQAGDDPRYMNWQLTARSGQHFMKVFREERQPGVFIMVDRRDNMRFGTQQRLKITQAAIAAATAAFSAQQNNYSVAATIMDDKQEWFKDSHSKQSIFDFIHQAAKPAAAVNNKSENKKKQPSLHDTLRTLDATVIKGTTIYLISDFHDLDEKSQAVLYSLASSHPVHALHIIDPAEIELPEAGVLSLHTKTLEKTAAINSNEIVEREKYQSSAQNNINTIKKLFESCAVSYQQILTADNIEKFIHL